jgi:DNA-binding response OmpR family regulator
MAETRGGQDGGALILVVERDPHVRELQALFLKEAGFAIEFAGDGDSAMERARKLRPHVVITEIMVPRLDGLALCRQLKHDPETQGVKVLIFSVLSASARAREAGADAFLRKPLAEQRLVDTVRQLVAGPDEGSPGESA